MTATLDCRYPGAVAWGKHYPAITGPKATNGAEGYRLVPAETKREAAS